MTYALRRKDPFQREKGLKRSFASDFVQKNEAGIAQLEIPFLLQFGQDAFDMHGVFQVFIQNKIQLGNLPNLERLAQKRTDVLRPISESRFSLSEPITDTITFA